MDDAVSLHALFTKQIMKKRNRVYEDGIATFYPCEGSANRFRIVIRNEEGDIAYQGFFSSPDGIPNEESGEMRVGDVLVEFGAPLASQPEAPLPPPVPQRTGLRKSALSRTSSSIARPLVGRPIFEPPKPAKPRDSGEATAKPPAAVQRVQERKVIEKFQKSASREKPRTVDEVIALFSEKPEAPPVEEVWRDECLPRVVWNDEDTPPQVREREDIIKVAQGNGQVKLVWAKQPISEAPRIPEKFKNLEHYRKDFVSAITFELNVRVQEVYRVYLAALFAASVPPPRCKEHGPAVFRIDKKGNYYYTCRSCNFYQPVPPDTPIPDRKSIRSISKIGDVMKMKGYAYHESTFLRNGTNCSLRFADEKIDNIEYSKDDLWVIFTERIDPIFCVSDGFGVSQGSRVDILPFFDQRLVNLPMQLRVTAIRLFNIQTERASLLKLFELEEEDVPIMPSLLFGSSGEATQLKNNDELIGRIADEISVDYMLNDDQKTALLKVADFFKPNSPPVLLVHGIFGAGKSKLLSVMAIFLDKILSELGMDDRILVAASTNVAVDNVLSNLKEFDFEDFTRVGSLRKIRRSLLPFVSGHGSEEAISELNGIINEADKTERSMVQEALKNARTEMSSKGTRLDRTRVVGVTCAATSFPVMAERKFTFVLLDECSQQTEPVSILPISFGCQRLICCGDPLQLPPAISKAAPFGYGRPLFSRLMKEFPPTMLSIQYRCHPSISNICSELFYQNRIKNGVTPEDRMPLFGMPTMCLFNVSCGSERFRGGSVCNDSEAIVVVALVRRLIELGVTSEEIGVIAFYKAQVDLISEPLSEGLKRPIVDISTVDAFQGDEREIIIITTAKTSKTSFVDSQERINVAISRAKRHLFVVSNPRALMESKLWNTIFAAASQEPNRMIRLATTPDSSWKPF